MTHEPLEQRTLLSLTVGTDKPDYAPCQTATISAAGLTPGETVEFLVLHVDDTPNTGAGHQPWQVADGGVDDLDGLMDGNIRTSWFVADDDSLGSAFQVTANGLVSGESATAYFTDNNDWNSGPASRVFYDDFPPVYYSAPNNSYYADPSLWAQTVAIVPPGPYPGGPLNPPNPNAYSARLNRYWGPLVSKSFDLRNSGPGALYYYVEPGGSGDWPEGGHDLLHVQYRNASHGWTDLASENSSDFTYYRGWPWGWQPDPYDFHRHKVTLPSGAFDSDFQFRFYFPTAGDDANGWDDWWIDNVELYVNRNPTVSLSGSLGPVPDGPVAGQPTSPPSFTFTSSDADTNLLYTRAIVTPPTGGAVTWTNGSSSGLTQTLTWGPGRDIPDRGLGTYSITVSATDAYGATSSPTPPWSFTLWDDDTTPPMISLDGSGGPAGGPTITESHGAPQKFTWTVTDPPDANTNVTSGVSLNAVIKKNGSTIATRSASSDNSSLSGEFAFDDQGLGTFEITVTATDFDRDRANDASPPPGSPPISASRTVVVTNADPVARAGLEKVVHEGDNVSFDGTASSDPDVGDSLTYSWNFDDPNDPTPGSGPTPSHVYADNGTYHVMLTVTDGPWGGTNSNEVIVRVENVPPRIESVTHDGTGAAGEPVTVTVVAHDVAADPLTYQFDFEGDGVFEVSNSTGSATYTFAADGVYPVNVRVSDGDGGEATGSVSVQVGAPSAVKPAVMFLSAGASVSEDAGEIAIAATLAEAIPVDALVPLTLSGTATDSADYTLHRYLLFPAGSTEATLLVQMIDDPIDEDAEKLILTMGTPINASLGGVTSFEITIEDNDLPPLVSFTTASQTAAEDAYAAVAVARLSEVSGKDITIPLVLSGTADTPADYTLPNGPSIVIPAGQPLGSAVVSIVDDNLPERNETVILTMLPPTNAVLSTLPGDATVHTITIPKNDAPSVSFTSAYQRVEENVGTVRIYATLSAAYYDPIDVPFTLSGDARSTSGGPADPIDYTLLTAGPLRFPLDPTTGQTTTTAWIDIRVEDEPTVQVAEGAESIVITMGSPPAGVLKGNTTRYVLQIAPNDFPTVSFTTPSHEEVWESNYDGNPIKVRIEVSIGDNLADEDLFVPVWVASNAAQVDADYTVLNSTITIPKGSKTGWAYVFKTANDSETEKNETINLELGAMTNAWRGARSLISVTIKDDDPLVNVSASRETYVENEGSMKFTLSLSAPTNKNVSVPLEYPGFRGQGWPSSITIFADALNSRETLNLPLQDDGVYGRNYAGRVRIGDGVSNAQVGERESSFWIKDAQSPPEVNLSVEYYETWLSEFKRSIWDGFEPEWRAFEEADQGTTGVVELTAPSQNPTIVTVEYVATGREDYIIRGDYTVSGTITVTIPANQLTREFSIPWQDDTLLESDEHWTVSISAVDGATRGRDWTQSFDVQDDDWLMNNDQIEAEYKRSFLYKVELAGRWLGDRLGIGHWGYISGATAFFDANKNGIHDFLDLNGDGIQDPNEPTEPWDTTSADGFFLFHVADVFDRDGSGLLEPQEGQVVLAGGVDTSTGLPVTMPLVAPIDSFIVSPATTLMAALVNQHGLSTDEAEARVVEALGLPPMDLTSIDPIGDTIAGDPDAPLVYAAEVKLLDTMRLVAEVVAAADNAPPLATVSNIVAADMAAKILDPGSSLDLGNSFVVQTLIEGTLNEVGLDLPLEIITGAAGVIAEGNRYIGDIAPGADLGFLEEVTRVKVVAQGTVAGQLAAAVDAQVPISQVVAEHTGPALIEEIGAAHVAAIVPSEVTISDASIVEGDQGESYLEFTVSLNAAPTVPVTVDFGTGGGTATPEVDYQPVSGTLTWDVGDEGVRTVLVPVFGDTGAERDESLRIALANVQNAIYARPLGEGTILNDDPITYAVPADGQDNHLLMNVDGQSVTLLRNDTRVFFGEFAQGVPIEILGAQGVENSLTIELYGDATGLAGGLHFQGGDLPSDALTIEDDAATHVVHTVTGADSGAFEVDGARISYTGVESVADQFAPAVTGLPAGGLEGTEVSLHAVPPDPAPTYSYAWSVTRNGVPYPTDGGNADFAFTPHDDGEYAIGLTLTADGRTPATTVLVLTVDNVAPQFEAGPDESLLPPAAGALARAGIAFTDPGWDVWSGTVDFGDGSKPQALVIDQAGKTFDLAHNYAVEGTFVVTVTLRDDDGGPNSGTFRVTVSLNTPPVASAGGPYAVAEGAAIGLDASGSFDAEQPAADLTYQWDLDGDGIFGETGAAASRGDETGATPTFYAGELSPSTITVSLRVTDDHGASHVDTAQITIEPKLTVQQVIVNGGAKQRSNVETIEVLVTGSVDVQALIDSGEILDLVKIYGLTAPLGQVNMAAANRFQWDSALHKLAIDMTIDGFGGSRQTMLADGKYQLQLVDSVFNDTDGLLDGQCRYDLHRLEGDFDGSGLVDLIDRDLFLTHYGSKAGQAKYDFAFDLTGDRYINLADYAKWTKLLGRSI